MNIGLSVYKHTCRYMRGYILLAVVIAGMIAISLFGKNEKVLFFVKSQDNSIAAEWNIPGKQVVLSVTGPNVKYKKNVNEIGKYVFENGKHGEIYVFTLKYIYRGKEVTQSRRRIFLDFKKLPELMTVNIETEDGEDPTYERAIKPKNAGGSTITKNYYKKATFNNIPVKIRIRGNTSAFRSKKPYKLLFKKNVDLLEMGEEYADTDWHLLAGGDRLKTYFGLNFSKLAGMEWEPRMRFVNLMLNGDWKGVYVLCETVKRHPKRVNISKKGYLIESDAYYWNQKGNYFKSGLLSRYVGFTFKYPKIGSKFDPKVLAMEKQMKTMDELIKKASSKVYEFIDLDTFCAWELIQDIMGNKDMMGSNMYFYKYNMDKKNKPKMGPVWDFDTIFSVKDNQHSAFYSTNVTYFPYLLKDSIFRYFYKEKYFSITSSIEEKMSEVLEAARNTPGLEESRKLDGKVWGVYKPIDTEIEEMKHHLHERIKWLNEEIAKL